MDAKEKHEKATHETRPETAQFDPSRMVGIIKRKALIKELAAAYHAECLAYCQELLQLQRKWEEQRRYIEAKPPDRYIQKKAPEDTKLSMKPTKRPKKGL